MSDKELIKQEIERLIAIEEETSHLDKLSFNSGRWKALTQVKVFIDSLPEESTIEDLEEEVHKHLLNIGATIEMYSGNVMGLDLCEDDYVDFARHFAEWQKQQMIEKACKVYCNHLCGWKEGCRQAKLYEDCAEIEKIKQAMEGE